MDEKKLRAIEEYAPNLLDRATRTPHAKDTLTGEQWIDYAYDQALKNRASRANPPHSPDQPPTGTTGEAGGDPEGTGGTGRFQVRFMNTIEPQETHFVVPGLIPDADLTVLVGEEGIGKGLWWSSIVARVTRDGHRVLVLCGEDDYERTVRPRLDVAGADVNLVATMVVDADALTGQPLFPTNLVEVRQAVEEYGFKLVIIDPWVSAVSGGLRLHDSQDARKALDPLTTFARNANVAVLAVAHPNRGEGSLRDRVGLTAVLRQAARVLIFALEDPDDQDLLYVGIDKANGASRDPAALYRKVPADHSIGQVWRVEAIDNNDARTIRDWARQFNRGGADDDGRTSDRWPKVVEKAAQDGMMISRIDIVRIYTESGSNESAADKAISRWKRNSQLTQHGPGVYEIHT